MIIWKGVLPTRDGKHRHRRLDLIEAKGLVRSVVRPPLERGCLEGVVEAEECLDASLSSCWSEVWGLLLVDA